LRGVSDSGSHKKISNGLVALSSAAILAVYTAGYVRTKSAADRFARQAETRRPAIPAPSTSAPATIVPPAPQLPSPAANVPARPVASTKPSTSGGTTRTVRPATDSVGRPAAKPRRMPSRSIPPAAEPTFATPSPLPVPEVPPTVGEQIPSVTPAATPQPTKPQYKEGTYFGWGTSRHGDIQAQVVIQDGRILSATIAQCLTRYSCSVIAKLPPQVAERQSPETDYVSGATQSTNAFYYAVVEALSKAK
jgi:uncharacterized protein with FMN-binding domain